MVVAGGDVGAALLQHEAGEADPTPDLKNVFARDGKPTHLLGEREPSRPYDTKERPGGGGDSDSLGTTVRIRELPSIAKGPNLIGHRSDLIPGRFDLVPLYSPIHVEASIASSGGGGYGFRDLPLRSSCLKRSWYPLDRCGMMLTVKSEWLMVYGQWQGLETNSIINMGSRKAWSEIFADVQKGLLARPQRCEDPRRTLFGTLRI